MQAEPAQLTGLEALLLLGFFASLVVVACGWTAARLETEKYVPPGWRDDIRFMVDPFMWSRSAPRSMQRKYIAALGCFILGWACLTAFMWGSQGYPWAVVPSVMLAIMTGTFAWRCFQHWRDI